MLRSRDYDPRRDATRDGEPGGRVWGEAVLHQRGFWVHEPQKMQKTRKKTMMWQMTGRIHYHVKQTTHEYWDEKQPVLIVERLNNWFRKWGRKLGLHRKLMEADRTYSFLNLRTEQSSGCVHKRNTSPVLRNSNRQPLTLSPRFINLSSNPQHRWVEKKNTSHHLLNR